MRATSQPTPPPPAMPRPLPARRALTQHLPQRPWSSGWLVLVAILALLIGQPQPVEAHDPSSWGGLFRSRDGGAHWFVASEGRFITAVVDVAVSPIDPNLLLVATDGGLLRSPNGGRDWAPTGVGQLQGLVTAVAFSPDGTLALAADAAGLFASDDGGQTWRGVVLPASARPIQAIQFDGRGQRVYLVTRNALLASEDGRSWQDLGAGLPGEAAQLLALRNGQPYALAGGRVFTRAADGWRLLASGLPAEVDFLAAEPQPDGDLWAASQGSLYRSRDGQTWVSLPAVLDPPSTRVHGLRVTLDGRAILLATDHGLYRSADDGAHWESLTDNLPAHLEAGPLLPDPTDSGTFYAGFSVTPYTVLRESAASGARALRLTAVNLIGAAAFLLLLIGSAGLALRWLARYYGDPSARTPVRRQPAPLEERPRHV